MNAGKLGIGIIGGMGRGPAVGMLFNLTGRAEVRAVADLNPAAFEVGRERFEAGGAKPDLYTDTAAMLQRRDLDWVIVGTPDRTHCALAKQVIESGHNVLVEKPMTQTLSEADQLCALVAKAGVRLVVGCELRYSAFADTYRRLLRDGLIGRPVTGNFIDHIGTGYTFFLRDYRRKEWSRGLQTQKGIHSIDLINDFADAAPVRVYASGGLDFFGRRADAEGRHCRDCPSARECPYSFHTVESPTWVKGGPRERGAHAFDHCVFKPDTNAEDNMQVQIEYDSGFRCVYTAVYFAPKYEREFLIWGTKGSLHGVMGTETRITFSPFTAKARPTPQEIAVEAAGGAHHGADERFVRAIIDATGRDAPLRPNALDGRAAVAVTEAAQRSMESHQAVEIPAPPSA